MMKTRNHSLPYPTFLTLFMVLSASALAQTPPPTETALRIQPSLCSPSDVPGNCTVFRIQSFSEKKPSQGKPRTYSVEVVSSLSQQTWELPANDKNTQGLLRYARIKKPSQLKGFTWLDGVSFASNPRLSWSRLTMTAAKGGFYAPPSYDVMLDTLVGALSKGKCPTMPLVDEGTLEKHGKQLVQPADWKNFLARITSALGKDALVRNLDTKDIDPQFQTCNNRHIGFQRSSAAKPLHVAHCGGWRFQCWSRPTEKTLPQEAVVAPPIPPPGSPMKKLADKDLGKEASSPADPPPMPKTDLPPPAEQHTTNDIQMKWIRSGCEGAGECARWGIVLYGNRWMEVQTFPPGSFPVLYARRLSTQESTKLALVFEKARFAQMQPSYLTDQKDAPMVIATFRLPDGTPKEVRYHTTSLVKEVNALEDLENQLIAQAGVMDLLSPVPDQRSTTTCEAKATILLKGCIEKHCNMAMVIDQGGAVWFRKNDKATNLLDLMSAPLSIGDQPGLALAKPPAATIPTGVLENVTSLAANWKPIYPTKDTPESVVSTQISVCTAGGWKTTQDRTADKPVADSDPNWTALRTWIQSILQRVP